MEVPKTLIYCDQILTYLNNAPEGSIFDENELSEALNIPKEAFSGIVSLMHANHYCLFTSSGKGVYNFHLRDNGRNLINTTSLEKEWIKTNTPQGATITQIIGNTGNVVNQSSIKDSQMSLIDPKIKASKRNKIIKFAIGAIGLISGLIAIYEFFIKPYIQG